MPQLPTTSHTDADRVLQFWLGDGVQLGWPSEDMKARWFLGGAALDAQIKDEFGTLVLAARQGHLTAWEVEPLSRLALVILLDQFTRNVYRGTAEAFASDAQAQRLVLGALEKDWDRLLPIVGRVFLYMPLMHAENIRQQRECVRRFEQLVADAPADLQERLGSNLDFARQHLDIIERFGRFPYRNAVLGRSNTAEEEAFLQNGPRFGQ